MTYQSLYRRRRPLKFAEMTGQEHITRTLGNALSRDRLTHAYLFSGPRGTGKTTAAKILARAMNCDLFPSSEPCGTCASCQEIASGASVDVLEMDAASNRGIDEIRELREKARYAGAGNRHKVYIIDEAHMLTTEACNAFLKTLEEPPPGVVFILATTDPSRLPSTILSRCQRFDFHLLNQEQILHSLKRIVGEEGWQADPGALGLIARLADGSMRDALGILEQCAAYGEANIGEDQVRIVTGATRSEAIIELTGAALQGDLDRGLDLLGEVLYSGRDLFLFIRDLVFVFSRLLLAGGTAEEDCPGMWSGIRPLKEQYRDKVAGDRLLDAVELLHETGHELRRSGLPQHTLEVAYMRLVRVLHNNRSQAGYLTPGREVSGGGELQPAQQNLSPGGGKSQEETPAPLHAVNKQDNSTGRLEDLKTNWSRLVEEIKSRQKSTGAWLAPATLENCQGNLVLISYAPEYSIHRERVMDDSHRKLVEEVLSNHLNCPVRIKAINITASIIKEDESAAGAFIGRENQKYPESPARGRSAPPRPLDKPGKKLRPEEAKELFGGRIIDPE